MKFLAEYKGHSDVYQIFGYDGDFESFKSALRSEGYGIQGELKYCLRKKHLQFGDVLVMQGYHVVGIFDITTFLIHFNVITKIEDESECEDNENEDEDSFESNLDDIFDRFSEFVPFEEIKHLFECDDECECGNNESVKDKAKENFETYKEKAKDEAEVRTKQARAFLKQSLYDLSKKL